MQAQVPVPEPALGTGPHCPVPVDVLSPIVAAKQAQARDQLLLFRHHEFSLRLLISQSIRARNPSDRSWHICAHVTPARQGALIPRVRCRIILAMLKSYGSTPRGVPNP